MYSNNNIIYILYITETGVRCTGGNIYWRNMQKNNKQTKKMRGDFALSQMV